MRLATGQQMAAFLRNKGVSVTTLTRAQIREGNGGAELDGLTAAQRDAVLSNTPLWFYILREAELGNGKLRGVGGASSPRRSTAPWRGARSPSSASPTGARRSA